MFNLIVRSADWDTGRETMSVSRVFEYTDDHIADQFRQNGSPYLDRLVNLPCLFMQEGTGDEIARVGHIDRARIVGGDIAFEYTLDAEVPPLRNSMIYANRMSLDMRYD